MFRLVVRFMASVGGLILAVSMIGVEAPLFVRILTYIAGVVFFFVFTGVNVWKKAPSRIGKTVKVPLWRFLGILIGLGITIWMILIERSSMSILIMVVSMMVTILLSWSIWKKVAGEI